MTIALRHARHFSTAVTSTRPISISQFKNKLKTVHDPDKAIDIYKSFTAANDPSTAPSSVSHAREHIIQLLAKSNRFSDIETFLESHKSCSQITHEPFISSLIRSHGSVGMFDNALKTYNQMIELGTPRSSLSFNALISACNQCKLFDQVPTYFNELPAKFGFLPDNLSYGILIMSYCEMGSPELAIEKLDEMKRKGFEVSVIVFTSILHSLYKNGRSDEAEKFWNEMVLKKGIKPDVGCYNVRLLHIQHDHQEAIKGLIEEMKSAGVRPDVISYNHMITCYCKSGMIDEAEKLYKDMLKGKGGCVPNTTTFRNLAYRLCNHGQFVAAYKVFKDSVREPKIAHHFGVLKCLVEGLARMGHKKEAIDVIRDMKQKLPRKYLSDIGQLAKDLA